MSQLSDIQQETLNLLRIFDGFCREHQISYFIAGGTLLGAVRHRGFIPWDDDADVVMPRSEYEKFRRQLAQHPVHGCFFIAGDEEPGNPHTHSRFCTRESNFFAREMPLAELNRSLGIDVFILDGAPDCFIKRMIHHWMTFFYLHAALLFANGSSGRRMFGKFLLMLMLKPFFSLEKLKSKSRDWTCRYSDKPTRYLVCPGGRYGYKKELFPREMFASFIELEFEDIKLPAPENFKEYLTGHYGQDHLQIPDPIPVVEKHYIRNEEHHTADFSLVIATIGRTLELKRFLEHLDDCRLQIQLIVVDQNPDDRLQEILAPFSDKFALLHLKSAPVGVSAARNLALPYITGRYVAFPDDDCVYPPGLLGDIREFFRRYPAVDGVLGKSIPLDKTSSRTTGKITPVTRNNLFFHGETFVQFFQYRSIRETGEFSLLYNPGGSGFQGGEDSEYLIRALQKKLVLYRNPAWQIRHPQNKNLADALIKAEKYGTARMALLEQYHYPLSVKLLHVLWPLRKIFSSPKFACRLSLSRLKAINIKLP